jgi:hypothetical protein
VARDELIDTRGQLFDGAERTSADCLVGDQGGETFDLVKPRTVGWNEMHVPAGVCCQPRLDLRVLETAGLPATRRGSCLRVQLFEL